VLSVSNLIQLGLFFTFLNNFVVFGDVLTFKFRLVSHL